MSLNKTKLVSLLPAFFPSLMEELQSFGFTPTLVGGAVRDFFKHGKLAHDWDFELTHQSMAFDKDIWKQLGKSLSRHGKVNFLPYEIIRLELQHYQLEFSPPRKETFEPHLSSAGHKNFSAEFDFKMPFSEAVLRRDFTINTMGIRFHTKEIEFLDPLDGVRHLREGILHPAGPDFPKDPVRFLRALRFASKYKMELSPELKVHLQSMEAIDFSAAYLWTEMVKSGDPLSFYYLMVKWSAYHPEMKLPLGKEIIPKFEELKKMLVTPSLHESWIVALEWVGLSSENWQKYFSQSSESGRRLGRWAQQSKSFQKILPETFHGEFEVAKEHPEFAMLFDWYFTTKQLLQKNPELPLMKMIEDYLPDWIHLYRFEPVKDVKHIDPPLRAKYQVWNLCQRL
ncbi:MAG TPA: hypothetical protein VNJ08_09685 [Bacteriovoracaceae bacterium]|nr:hypothetical protein [Bacteriovoracaceae bacterium]